MRTKATFTAFLQKNLKPRQKSTAAQIEFCMPQAQRKLRFALEILWVLLYNGGEFLPLAALQGR
jgi:hypothetical protein